MTKTAIETQLVDTDVVYCDGDDVFTYIRNKAYSDLGTSSKPTQEQVDNLIARMSERIDNRTNRAWRIRKVVDLERGVKFSHKQKNPRHRRRRLRGRSPDPLHSVDPRGMVNLPHIHIKTIDSAQNDAVIVLNPRATNDITDTPGRESGDYVVDERKGIIRPELTLFTPAGTRVHGPIIEGAEVRVSYRYGEPYSTTDHSGTAADHDFKDSNWSVSSTVPGDITEACALLVAWKLLASDQYGNLTPSNAGDSPDLSSAIGSLKSEANSIIKDHARKVP